MKRRETADESAFPWVGFETSTDGTSYTTFSAAGFSKLEHMMLTLMSAAVASGKVPLQDYGAVRAYAEHARNAAFVILDMAYIAPREPSHSNGLPETSEE